MCGIALMLGQLYRSEHSCAGWHLVPSLFSGVLALGLGSLVSSNIAGIGSSAVLVLTNLAMAAGSATFVAGLLSSRRPLMLVGWAVMTLAFVSPFSYYLLAPLMAPAAFAVTASCGRHRRVGRSNRWRAAIERHLPSA